MKTDSLFYRIFQTRPQLLFELLSNASQTTSHYEFTSVEVKQLAKVRFPMRPTRTLGSHLFRIDGVFLPQQGDDTDPFYLVEVQFQPDDDLYYRIFSELFLYLKQYQPPHPWRVVVIYPSRSVERENQVHFQGLLTSQQVTRIYLDELEETKNSPLGVRLVKLITSKETEASQKVQTLLESVSREVEETKFRNDIIDVIESIMVYKFPQMSRKEIAGMLGVDDLKQTRFYQEIEQETKLEAVQKMLESGVDLESIAQWLDLPMDVVREQANKKGNS